MKKTFILIPQNEGQELACRVKVKTTLALAKKIAVKMAGEIHAALLAQCDIGVMIQTESETLRGDAGIIGRWDGKLIDGKTGGKISTI